MWSSVLKAVFRLVSMCKKIIVSPHCKSSTDWKAEGRDWLCTSPVIP